MKDNSTGSMPAISVVIPTCNRHVDLERCLDKLAPQLEAVGGVQIIVTDDGDAEQTEKSLAGKFPTVLWTQGPRRGPAANRNHGVKVAQGEWLVFLDDDCIPDPDFLRTYLDTAKEEGLREMTFFEGATVHQSPPPSLLWEAPHNPSGGLLISCNFAITRKTYEAVGRFDERYPFASFEDTEFAARFLAKGGVSKFLPEAKVVHPLRRRPSSLKHARMWEGRVIYALDQGASALRILANLPWHVLRISQWKLAQQRGFRVRIHCFFLLLGEWLCVVWMTPGWILKWQRKPRSKFWVDYVASHGPAPKYGF
jgi:GT2 family glycosyltransferase